MPPRRSVFYTVGSFILFVRYGVGEWDCGRFPFFFFFFSFLFAFAFAFATTAARRLLCYANMDGRHPSGMVWAL